MRPDYRPPRWQRDYQTPLSEDEMQALREKASGMGFLSVDDRRLSSLEREAIRHVLKRLGGHR
jgi:hypothetical protein